MHPPKRRRRYTGPEHDVFRTSWRRMCPSDGLSLTNDAPTSWNSVFLLSSTVDTLCIQIQAKDSLVQHCIVHNCLHDSIDSASGQRLWSYTAHYGVLQMFYYYFLTLDNIIHNPRELKIGHARWSVCAVCSRQTVMQCRKTALKRCTKIEILWYRKMVSLLPGFSEILFPRSLRRWQADALKRPRSPQVAQTYIRAPRSTYFSSLRVAAISASRAALCCQFSGHVTVTSQHNELYYYYYAIRKKRTYRATWLLLLLLARAAAKL